MGYIGLMSMDYHEKIIEMIHDTVPGIILRTDSGDGYWDEDNEVCLSFTGTYSVITYSENRVQYDVSLICSERCYNSYLDGTFCIPGGYYIYDKNGSILQCEDLEYQPWDRSVIVKLNAQFSIPLREELYGNLGEGHIKVKVDRKINNRFEILDIRCD